MSFFSMAATLGLTVPEWLTPMRVLNAILVAFVLSCSLFAQTVDEVIAKSVAARGGLEKIKAVRALRMTGHVSLGSNVEAVLIFEAKRPGMVREELQLNDKAIIRV